MLGYTAALTESIRHASCSAQLIVMLTEIDGGVISKSMFQIVTAIQISGHFKGEM